MSEIGSARLGGKPTVFIVIVSCRKFARRMLENIGEFTGPAGNYGCSLKEKQGITMTNL